MKHARFAAGALAASLSFTAPAAAQADDRESRRLGQTIEQAMQAEGPWLLPAEQALVARKCGYAQGSRDGESITMNNGVLVCANGRRVDDPEVRAMMAVAGPRIARRVQATMDSPAVRNAISALSDRAVQRALERVRDWSPDREPRR